MLALQLYDRGILAIPCNHDKPIRPYIDYSHWREDWPNKWPSREEFEAKWRQHPDAAYLMMCEYTESVDLDTKNQEFGQDIIGDFEAEVRRLDPFLLDKIFVESSPSGGRHYIYRTKTMGASCTLARRHANDYELSIKPSEKFLTLVDYLAHGKMCRIYPSHGYKLINGDILDIPVISDDERRTLISAALSLNSYYEKHSYTGSNSVNGERPGDDYNERTSPDDMLNVLQAHGWRFLRRNSQYIELNRPGARNSRGVDATINTDQKWFYPWSSSCGFPQTKAYDFFGTYAILEHNGDIARAAKALGANGYGRQEQQQQAPQRTYTNGHTVTPEEPKQFTTWTEKLAPFKFDWNRKFNPEWMLYHRSPYTPGAEEIPLCANGQILSVIGPAKSFKTQVVDAIVSSSLGRKHVTGFEIRMPFGKEKIMLFDTEQDNYWFDFSVRLIHYQANVNYELPNFMPYSLVTLDHSERMAAMMAMIDEHPDVGLVVIDGILDIVRDFNDPKEASKLSDYLMMLKSKGVMVIVVCHTGEAKGNQLKPIGAVGSMILRKAEVFIILEIQNPKEEDERYRRVKIKSKHGRGRGFRSVEVMSYQKMLYLAGHEVPEHYKVLTGNAPAPEKQSENPAIAAGIDTIPVPPPPMPNPRMEPDDSDAITSVEPKQEPQELLAQYGWVLEGESVRKEDDDDALFEEFLNET